MPTPILTRLPLPLKRLVSPEPYNLLVANEPLACMGLGALFLSFLFETSNLAITAIVLVLHEYVLMIQPHARAS